MGSTTFHMVAMPLMAVWTVLTCGGLLTWAYLRETRGSGDPPAPRVMTSGRRSAGPDPLRNDDREGDPA